METKSILYGKMRYRVDVTTDRSSAKLESFTDSGTAPHEGVEDNSSCQSHRLVEHFKDIGPFRGKCSYYNSPEDRTEPLGPPLVDVIDGTVEFFPPAFNLCNVTKRFKRKSAILDSPDSSKGE
jgi:hypothetical protein